MSENKERVSSITCSSCGGGLSKSVRQEWDADEEEMESTKIAKCLSCGAEYEYNTQEYYALYADEINAGCSDGVFHLGMKGTINDIEYEIIGHLRYQEEDDEYGEIWDEWFTVSSNGTYHYFVVEDGKIYSYNEYIPEEIDLESQEYYISFEGKKIRKVTAYIGRIIFADGELPWEPEIGEAVTCYDIKKGGEKYSIEQSEGEVSITKGEPISVGDIINGFNLTELMEPYNNTVRMKKQYKVKSIIYLLFAIFSLAMFIFNTARSKSVQGEMNKYISLGLNQPKIVDGKTSYFSQTLYGPFKLEKANGLYDVTIGAGRGVIHSFDWMDFRWMLISQKRLLKNINKDMSVEELKMFFDRIDTLKEPVENFSIMGNFWAESGYDSEGSWYEEKVSDDKSIVVDESGLYYAYIETNGNKSKKMHSLLFSIKQVESSRMFFILIVVFFFLRFINKSKSRNYNELDFDFKD